MKILFKSAVTLCFIAIICIVLSLLLSAMKEIFISSWFIFNKSVVVGVLSGLALTCIIALIQLLQYQRESAKERAVQLGDFCREANVFQAIVTESANTAEMRTVSDAQQQVLGTTLTRLNELATRMLRGERFSPIQSATKQWLKRLASTVSKAETAFLTALLPLSEHCHAAEQAHHVLPYLTDESEKQKNRLLLHQSLEQMLASLARGGALDLALLQYESAIHRFLGKRNPQI